MITQNKKRQFATLSSLVMLIGVAASQAATNSANNETGVDQISDGCSITIREVSGNKWEYFRVPAGISTVSGSNLQPRAERGLDPHTGGANLQGSNLTDGRKVIILKGQCGIESANETTIIQIYNWDPTNSDKGVPYLQLKAQKQSGSRWPLTINGTTICNVEAKIFDFEIRTNNKEYRVTIKQDGRTLYNERRSTSAYRGRAGITRFRFGSYHRDDIRPYVDGQIRFRKTVSSSATVTANTGV
jgi:hypothetical protein